MPADFEAQLREFDVNLADLFKELQSGLAVDIDKLQPIIAAAYKDALTSLNTKLRVLEDVVAICKIDGDVDDGQADGKYRKIVGVLRGGGFIPK